MSKWKKLFDEYETAKQIWNSPMIGLPLWLIAFGVTIYWLLEIPPPGFAIGALATVAGIMSIRDIKTLGKIVWGALLICLLVTEFRAIDKDRAANERAQRTFFSEQENGFESIQHQAKTDFDTTIKGLQSTIGGLNTNIEIATKTFQQTRPHALIEFTGEALVNPILPNGHFSPSSRYLFELHYENEGSKPAVMLHKFSAIYIGKPDNLIDQKRLAARFEKDWTNYLKSDHHPPPAMLPYQPEWSSPSRTFSNEEIQRLNNAENTIYIVSRIAYHDQTGTWWSDSCAHFQAHGRQIDINIFHQCLVLTSDRYPAGGLSK